MLIDEDNFLKSISTLRKSDLCCQMHRELSEMKAIQSANEAIYTEVQIQYAALEETCSRLQQENSKLSHLLETEINKKKLRANYCSFIFTMYGKSNSECCRCFSFL